MLRPMPGVIERYRDRLPFAAQDPVVSLDEGSTPQLADRHPVALVNSVNDFRIEGQKTAAFEIAEALEGELDALCIPVGNAGNITAYWRGFTEAGHRPRMLGFQAAGAAPLVEGRPVEHPETVASAIRIGNPARREDAMAAMSASGGAIRAVTDAQILDAYRFLA